MNDLLAAHLDRVYRFLYRLTGDPHEAADLSQETFLRAWRGRAKLRDANAARTWLLRIAANVFRDSWRKQSRRPTTTSLDAGSLSAGNGEATKSLAGNIVDASAIGRFTLRIEQQEEVQAAIAAMQTLPARQREVLSLHACEQLSIDEIADVLEIDRNAVKASLSIARSAMRKKLLLDKTNSDTNSASASKPQRRVS